MSEIIFTDVPKEIKRKKENFNLQSGVTFRDAAGKQQDGPPAVTSMSHMSKFEYSKVASKYERKESAMATSRPISKRASVKIDESMVSPSNLDFIKGMASDRGPSNLTSNKPTSAKPSFRRSQDFIIKSSTSANPLGQLIDHGHQVSFGQTQNIFLKHHNLQSPRTANNYPS
jgi:hypothetical protein